MVKERVDREFNVDSEKYDPDECVAKGAAIWAVKRKIEGLAEKVGYDPETGEGNKAAFKKALDKEIETVRNRDYYLTLPGKSGGNVSSHTYGLIAYDGDTAIVVPLLAKNTEIPFTYESGPRQFGTAVANQATIELVLMEADGDSLDPALCKEIGRGDRGASSRRSQGLGGQNLVQLPRRRHHLAPRPGSFLEPRVRGEADAHRCACGRGSGTGGGSAVGAGGPVTDGSRGAE